MTISVSSHLMKFYIYRHSGIPHCELKHCFFKFAFPCAVSIALKMYYFWLPDTLNKWSFGENSIQYTGNPSSLYYYLCFDLLNHFLQNVPLDLFLVALYVS